MASGPEHFRQAEELAAYANTPDNDPDYVDWCQRQAQVHATLAHVWLIGRAHYGSEEWAVLTSPPLED